MADNSSFETVQDERTARAVIASVTPPGDIPTNRVLRLTGSGLETLRLALGNEPIGGVPRPDLHLWRRRFDTAEPESVLGRLEEGNRLGQQLLIPGDRHWPTGIEPRDLRAPVALWAEGNTSLLSDPVSSRAALVGTDQPSEYAAEVVEDLAKSLAADGRTIVTVADRGIARGAIEGAHHESSRVIVVLPHAIEHQADGFQDLQAHVAVTGLLVSLYPPGTDTVRDASDSTRLLAGLSGATTVVEERPGWDYRWGSASVAATHFGRPVGAVPGRVGDSASQGTNRLIRQGDARLIESGADIADLLDQSRNGSNVPSLTLSLAARRGIGLGR